MIKICIYLHLFSENENDHSSFAKFLFLKIKVTSSLADIILKRIDE